MQIFFDIPKTLHHFKTYRHYLTFAKSLFALDPDEYKDLFSVLIKLQGIGEDPVKLMQSWKDSSDASECAEFIRFMIQVNKMELAELKKAA
ncbi:MAG: hypothetical protein PHP23_04505 [Desulfobacterales bacterium]|nr:hypothetical protein [Desulfobacterales bacterium]MDD4073120.1 hypothetical protein [Desulfobacterales bacterium]MDD4391942.1 hypothetical protein [Desulfobacterales bacterium]